MAIDEGPGVMVGAPLRPTAGGSSLTACWEGRGLGETGLGPQASLSSFRAHSSPNLGVPPPSPALLLQGIPLTPVLA